MDKVSVNRQKKIDIVQEISEKIGRAKALVFTNYQGLTHKQLEELKKALKQANSELIVTKNTLLKLALEKSTAFRLQTTVVGGLPARLDSAKRAGKVGSQSAESVLSNPTAILFVYDDVIAPLKQIAKTIKSLGLPSIKFGIIDNQALTGDQVLKIASLPSREGLISQVVGTLKAPIFGLHRALSWNINNLVLTLKSIEKQKS